MVVQQYECNCDQTVLDDRPVFRLQVFLLQQVVHQVVQQFQQVLELELVQNLLALALTQLLN